MDNREDAHVFGSILRGGHALGNRPLLRPTNCVFNHSGLAALWTVVLEWRACFDISAIPRIPKAMNQSEILKI